MCLALRYLLVYVQLEGVVGISVFENSLFATTFSSLVRLPRNNVSVKSFVERQNKTKDFTTVRVVHHVRQPVPSNNNFVLNLLGQMLQLG